MFSLTAARWILRVLDIARGLLKPPLDPSQLAFVRGYGVAMAYRHDVGMVVFSRFGRAMRPEYASHPDVVIRSHVPHALHRCSYRALAEAAPLIQQQIEVGASQAAETEIVAGRGGPCIPG